MESILKPGETLDDLQNGYYIIQKEKAFRFGVDAVLLSDFVNVKKTDKVLEMGTGTGVISILLYAKRQPEKIIAIDIQEDMVEMARRSIKLNNLEEYIEVSVLDLTEAPNILGKGLFNAVIINPPYLKKGSGIMSLDVKQAAARFEIFCTLDSIIESSNRLLTPGGKLFMIHRCNRIVDVIYSMRQKRIEPKRIRFIHSTYKKKPNLFLIEGIKDGKPELKFMDPLYIYDNKGDYTEEINNIYGRLK